MKKCLFWCPAWAILVASQTLAAEVLADEWGPVTNNAQMSISAVLPGSVSGRVGFIIGGGTNPMGGYVTNPITVKSVIKPGEAFNLWVRLRNLSTNETLRFVFSGTDQDEENGLAWVILSPSGKDISQRGTLAAAHSIRWVLAGPSRIGESEFPLSRFCKLEEIGTYKITARKSTFARHKDEKAFVLTSNTLSVTVVPDK
jgi:hypothetical protein